MIVHVSNQDLSFNEGIAVSTFDRALELVRQHTGEKRIVVHGGLYPATHIILTAQDHNLTICNAGGEKPVLSGAVLVNNWSVDPETGWFTADAPRMADEIVDFRFLMTTDGRYLKKARYPLTGTLPHETVFTAATWVGSHAGGWQRPLLDEELNHFTYKEGDIPADFDDYSAEIEVFHSWNVSYCKLSNHDRANRIFWLTPNCTYPPGSLWRSEYAVYNTKEGMTEGGRWYCDRSAGKIYYRPLPEESVENFACFVPTTTKIIEFEDGCDQIRISGLTLTAATTPVVNEKYLYPCQRGGAGFGVMEQHGAIHGENIRNIEISDVEIRCTGGYGIKLRGESLYVKHCTIHTCGAGGIGISSPNILTPQNREEPWVSRVEDCHIENIGLDYKGAAGIFSDSVLLRNNHVANTPYTNIIANGDYCIVEGNTCINPMQELNDGACIYMHINKGCIVRNNICLSHNNTCAMAWGIYLDSDTTDFEVCGNYIRGFHRAMLDARKGGRNRWHHNYMEYFDSFNGDSTMRIEFPEDKRTGFDHNILHCEKLKFICAKDHFQSNEDLVANTAVCNDIVFEYRKTATQKSIVQDGPEAFLQNNTHAPYSHSTSSSPSITQKF